MLSLIALSNLMTKGQMNILVFRKDVRKLEPGASALPEGLRKPAIKYKKFSTPPELADKSVKSPFSAQKNDFFIAPNWKFENLPTRYSYCELANVFAKKLLLLGMV